MQGHLLCSSFSDLRSSPSPSPAGDDVTGDGHISICFFWMVVMENLQGDRRGETSLTCLCLFMKTARGVTDLFCFGRGGKATETEDKRGRVSY